LMRCASSFVSGDAFEVFDICKPTPGRFRRFWGNSAPSAVTLPQPTPSPVRRPCASRRDLCRRRAAGARTEKIVRATIAKRVCPRVDLARPARQNPAQSK
jgi:hypothetical protein